MKGKCNALSMVAWILVIVGALNWGLVAFDFNLVDWLFVETMGQPVVADVVYGLVGLAGVYALISMFTCKGK